MVRITETEFSDVDGQVRKIRTIEAAHARWEFPDGTIAAYSNCTAEEWPYSPKGSSPRWRVGIPGTMTVPGSPLPQAICLLANNGAVILRLIEISIAATLSQVGEDFLMGKEDM